MYGKFDACTDLILAQISQEWRGMLKEHQLNLTWSNTTWVGSRFRNTKNYDWWHVQKNGMSDRQKFVRKVDGWEFSHLTERVDSFSISCFFLSNAFVSKFLESFIYYESTIAILECYPFSVKLSNFEPWRQFSHKDRAPHPVTTGD